MSVQDNDTDKPSFVFDYASEDEQNQIIAILRRSNDDPTHMEQDVKDILGEERFQKFQHVMTTLHNNAQRRWLTAERLNQLYRVLTHVTRTNSFRTHIEVDKILQPLMTKYMFNKFKAVRAKVEKQICDRRAEEMRRLNTAAFDQIEGSWAIRRRLLRSKRQDPSNHFSLSDLSRWTKVYVDICTSSSHEFTSETAISHASERILQHGTQLFCVAVRDTFREMKLRQFQLTSCDVYMHMINYLIGMYYHYHGICAEGPEDCV